MNNEQIGRRRALRTAGIVAGGTAIAMLNVTPAAAGDGNSNGITGGWKLHRSDVTGDYDGIFTLAQGGAATYLDINPVAPRPLIGVWSESGHNFRYDLWTGFEADPTTSTPASTAQVVGHGTRSGNTFTSIYTVTFRDATTSDVLFTYDGTNTATSLHA